MCWVSAYFKCNSCTCNTITVWNVMHRHPKQIDIAILISRWRLFCYYILLFNDFMSFQDNVYQINMYLLLYLSFKIKVLEYTKLHYNAMLFMLCYYHFWRHNRLHCDIIMAFHCSMTIFHCSVMSFVLSLFRTQCC